MMTRLYISALGAVLISLLAGGCATYNSKIRNIESNFYSRRYTQAVALTNTQIRKKDNERLLYYMEKGLILHTAGKYKESNQAFNAAKALIRQLKPLSVTEGPARYLTNPLARAYKGEDFEIVLVNTYMGLNYLLMNNYEGALVEFKQVNLLLDKIQKLRKKKYQFNHFSIFLTGLCYELEDEADDAYVEYRRLYQLAPELELVRRSLIETAKKLNYEDDLKKWRRAFRLKEEPDPKNGRLILIYQAGKGPVKASMTRKGFSSTLPRFRRRFAALQTAVLSAGGKSEKTLMLNDIESVSIQNLDDKMAAIVADKTISYGVKGAAACCIASGLTRNKRDAACLTAILFKLFAELEQADLRCWHTLPATLNIARLDLAPGNYSVTVSGKGAYRGAQQALFTQTVSLKSGQTLFLNVRTTR